MPEAARGHVRDAATSGTPLPGTGAPVTVRHTTAAGGRVHVTTAVGEWTLPFARALSRDLDRRLTPATRHVILDVGGVQEGPETAMLLALLGVRNTMRRRDGRLTIVAAGERFERLVRISALDDLLTIVTTMDEALDGNPEDSLLRMTPSSVPTARHWSWRAEDDAAWRARYAVVDHLREHGTTEPQLGDIALVVSEAVTNVISHAYTERPTGEVRVTVDLSGQDLCLTVEDDGHGIIPRPDSGGLGLGLPLMATLADRVETRASRTGGTRLCLWFRRSEPEARNRTG